MKAVNLTKADFLNKVANYEVNPEWKFLGERPAIIDFYATWCGPCKMLAPVMEQLSDEITDVEFYNIDVDENPDLAREYRIMNIPAVIAIKGGQVAGQQIGLVSKDDMKGFIEGVF